MYYIIGVDTGSRCCSPARPAMRMVMHFAPAGPVGAWWQPPAFPFTAHGRIGHRATPATSRARQPPAHPNVPDPVTRHASYYYVQSRYVPTHGRRGPLPDDTRRLPACSPHSLSVLPTVSREASSCLSLLQPPPRVADLAGLVSSRLDPDRHGPPPFGRNPHHASHSIGTAAASIAAAQVHVCHLPVTSPCPRLARTDAALVLVRCLLKKEHGSKRSCHAQLPMYLPTYIPT